MLTHNEILLLKQLVKMPGVGYPLCNNADITLVENLVDIVRAQHGMLLRTKSVIDAMTEFTSNPRVMSLRFDLEDITLAND